MAVLRAHVVAKRTTTHKYASPAIDPSELGTEPSSRLLLKSLRVQHRTGTQRRDWAAMHNTGGRVRAAGFVRPQNTTAVVAALH